MRRLPELFKKLEQQGSGSLALIYLFRYLLRRGPIWARRQFEIRRDTAKIKTSETASIALRLGVSVIGGVGDHVIAARFMRDLRSSTEAFDFDVFSATPTVAEWIFSAVDGFKKCYQELVFRSVSHHYDLGLELSSVISVRPESREHAHNRTSEALKKVIENVKTFGMEMSVFANNSFPMHGFLAQNLQFRNATRATSLHHISDIQYGGNGFPLKVESGCLARFGLERKRYITVHNGFDAQYITSGSRATKCYPHFNEVITLLKEDFPDILFVQIGSITSIPMSQVDLNLIRRTSLQEASAIIEGSVAHLDNESGMVHIASCFSVPSCVVFGPTPSDYFAYADNVSIRPKTCGCCWWIKEDWMERCPRGFAEPICTYSQPPYEVAQAMTQLLARASVNYDAVRSASQSELKC